MSTQILSLACWLCPASPNELQPHHTAPGPPSSVVQSQWPSSCSSRQTCSLPTMAFLLTIPAPTLLHFPRTNTISFWATASSCCQDPSPMVLQGTYLQHVTPALWLWASCDQGQYLSWFTKGIHEHYCLRALKDQLKHTKDLQPPDTGSWIHAGWENDVQELASSWGSDQDKHKTTSLIPGSNSLQLTSLERTGWSQANENSRKTKDQERLGQERPPDSSSQLVFPPTVKV